MIRIGREIQCLPYAGFFFLWFIFSKKLISRSFPLFALHCFLQVVQPHCRGRVD